MPRIAKGAASDGKLALSCRYTQEKLNRMNKVVISGKHKSLNELVNTAVSEYLEKFEDSMDDYLYKVNRNKVELVERKCLSCGAKFMAEGRYNRKCPKCTKKHNEEYDTSIF